MNKLNLNDRIRGAIFGAIAGDALGVPVEFQSRKATRRNPVTGMRGYGTHNQPPGTWSDDSSLMLCTLESLVHCGEVSTGDMGQRFVRWRTEAHWTPHGRVFDIGIATSSALAKIGMGENPETAGGADEYSNGNGSLMRILPLALWLLEATAEDLVDAVHPVSALTHGHRRSQMACVFYCLMVQRLMKGLKPRTALAETVETFSRLYNKSEFSGELPHFSRLCSKGFTEIPEDKINSSGYVMDTLNASVWCLLNSDRLEETILTAVNLGGDTDTTGTVAGGLAGAYYGAGAIPLAWIESLVRREAIESLVKDYLRAHEAASL